MLRFRAGCAARAALRGYDARMRSIESVVVCGVGAVGAAAVERLHAMDPACVTVVADGARRERLEREGLTVNGRRFSPRVAAPSALTPADLLLVGVKHGDLTAAVEDARRAVGPRTVVMSLLNGISSEATLAEAYGADKVLPAFLVGNDVVREGTHVRYQNIGRLVFGAPSNDPADPRVLTVKHLLDRAGIPCQVAADIRREQWWKFMLNVGVNQVSALLRAPYGAFMLEEVRALARRAALEVVAVSRHEGVGLVAEDVERIFPVIAGLAPAGKTSMLQDVEAGRKTEVEIFAGAVVELGRRHAVATPTNAFLGQAIAALDAIAAARGAGGVA
ncbi:2-dehydropantoate 2-reductase [Anaeromyxobacter dehalogenans 2CP-1]|uniref:2-dehydropantoate 2-reductase n=2 Tax=Anaeromyxobacter dehalogenans TaxID=161493 RepID=B8J6F1_ANAD2|nr:2-dehydropantoate 2-reductase [Anaeromyxobacter dehalogenans 2CP-1]